MPLNLPPGTPNVVNPAVTPTWVFTPTTSAPATVRLSNTGRNPVYVGPAGVTQSGGLAIPPGGKTIELVGVLQTLYAVSPVAPVTLSATSSTSAVTAGSTAISLTTAVPSGLSAGTYCVIGSTANTGWEAQLIASTTASSQLTFANPLVNDHAQDLVYTATFLPAQIVVAGGVV